MKKWYRRHKRIIWLFIAVSLCMSVFLATRGSGGPRTLVGHDISYPQCSNELPAEHAFAIVGVNGGLASKANPCLATQLKWAARSTGAVTEQPRIQLYVNTGNPALQSSKWPHNNQDPAHTHTANPYGDCNGQATLACSWQYGWNSAVTDVRFVQQAATKAGIGQNPSNFRWWLDVETRNSWQSDSSEALARNRATLEGMAAYFARISAKTGIYSTGYQLGQIAGSIPATSLLYHLDSWLAGARDKTEAIAMCQGSPLVPGGHILLVQYEQANLDHNYACNQPQTSI